MEHRMHACLDVAYHDDVAVAACVLFRDWTDGQASRAIVQHIRAVAPYEPGQLYRRELPALLAVLDDVNEPLATLVIDGYVWLDRDHRLGLGAHLFIALGRSTPVIGVAKTVFRGHRPSRSVEERGTCPCSFRRPALRPMPRLNSSERCTERFESRP